MTRTRSRVTKPKVARTKIFPVRITLPLTDKMVERIDELCAPDKTPRVIFIREAVEREIKRRSRKP